MKNCAIGRTEARETLIQVFKDLKVAKIVLSRTWNRFEDIWHWGCMQTPRQGRKRATADSHARYLSITRNTQLMSAQIARRFARVKGVRLFRYNKGHGA